jgi:hypothetical protein
VGFEATITASGRPKVDHALGRSATVTGVLARLEVLKYSLEEYPLHHICNIRHKISPIQNLQATCMVCLDEFVATPFQLPLAIFNDTKQI